MLMWFSAQIKIRKLQICPTLVFSASFMDVFQRNRKILDLILFPRGTTYGIYEVPRQKTWGELHNSQFERRDTPGFM